MISSVIHPFVGLKLWGNDGLFSPFKFCYGTMSIKDGSLNVSYDPKFHNSTQDFFVLDFAGSGAVHLLGGMGGLLLSVCLKIEQCLKKRSEKDERKSNIGKHCSSFALQVLLLLKFAAGGQSNDPNMVFDESEKPQLPGNFWKWMYHLGPEHIEYAALGVLILWTTWFAFNCGSTESIAGGRSGDIKTLKIYHAVTGRIALNMVVCAGSGGLMAIMLASLVQLITNADSINTNEIANGILSCLVAITGCCAFVTPWVAFTIGRKRYQVKGLH
jgi:Amt family ammonium transporter